MSKIIDDILAREGGYVDRSEDRGGPTKYGITLKILSAYRGRPCTKADVANLTQAEAEQIYSREYLKPFEWITDDVLLKLVVNSAVQHGVEKTTKLLQAAVGTDPDGHCGEKTMQAVYNAQPATVTYRLASQRARYYGDIIAKNPSQRVFAAGWFRRLADDLS